MFVQRVGVTRISKVIMPFVVAIAVASCSSNKTKESVDIAKPTVMKNKEGVGKRVVTPVKVIPQANKVAKPVKRRVTKKNVKKRPAAARRVAKKRNYNRRNYNNSWTTHVPHRLSGDFSNNPEAIRFINHMVRDYGFNRNYLNKVLSQARDTGLRVKPLRKKKKKSSRTGSWTRYRNYFITPRHINGGVNFWRKNAGHLQRASRQYGVPPEYIVAILGVETIYGGNVGKHRVIDALATKSFIRSRRSDFYRNELEKFLLMARSEGLNPLTTMGSTSGAVGLCQFMPSNFKSLGVDYNRNGRCNLWDPADAIGSVANYFQKHGWKSGRPVAVRAYSTSNKYKRLKSGYKTKHSLRRLKSKGVTPADGNIDNMVRLIRLSTNSGEEVWLGGHNFYVITRYNHSSKHAMAVHQLAQEIKRRYHGQTVALLDTKR